MGVFSCWNLEQAVETRLGVRGVIKAPLWEEVSLSCNTANRRLTPVEGPLH